jgi:hypothetical protein
MPMLTALLLAATGPAPAISSEKIGEKRYRIVLTAPGLTLEQGQLRAGEEAMRLCRGPATLGHHAWRSDEKLDSSAGARTATGLTLEQVADCGAPPPPVVPRPTGWQPGPTDMKAIMDRTASYFEARDSGRFRDAWSLLTPSMQEMTPLPEWQASRKAFNDRAGGGLRRKAVKVTWYDNPPNAPLGGIFAAVDFVGSAQKARIICGYLMWLRQVDGSWRITREEEGTLEDSPGVTSTPQQIARSKAAIGCVEPD